MLDALLEKSDSTASCSQESDAATVELLDSIKEQMDGGVKKSSSEGKEVGATPAVKKCNCKKS